MSAITFRSSSSLTLMFLPLLTLLSLDKILALFRSVELKLKSDKLEPAEWVAPGEGKSKKIFVRGGPSVGFPNRAAVVILDDDVMLVVNAGIVDTVCSYLICGRSCPMPDAVVMVTALVAMVTMGFGRMETPVKGIGFGAIQRGPGG